MVIDGKTKLFLVIGDPIAQVKSPDLYTRWCVAHGIDAVFVPFQINTRMGTEVFHALRHVPNLAGMIVTIPFKPLAATCCEHLTARAKVAGAVNVIRPVDGQWYGDAQDGVGCIAALSARNVNIPGTTAQIVGAGGAGASVAAALAEAGVARLGIVDLDMHRAANLADRLGREFPTVTLHVGRIAPDDVTIFVNASPCGMAEGDPLPIAIADIKSEKNPKVLVEMIMQPSRTQLFIRAEEMGCMVVPGLEVLGGQQEETLKFFELN